MLPPNNRKGSGFTNINRVVTANQGNKLGQTVSSGVQNQANQVKQQTQQSTTNFNQEAQKNRLDTQEAADKRQNVIGRFDETKYNPDESQFKVSEGLQSRYASGKSAIEERQKQQNLQNQQQRAGVQSQLDTNRAGLTQAQARINKQKEFAGLNPTQSVGMDIAMPKMMDGYTYDQYLKDYTDEKRFAASIKPLEDILGIQQASQTNYDSQIAKELSDFESQYGEMTAAEKATWIQSEKDRMMSENLPTDQEITEFGKYRAGIYDGPKQLTDFQTLAGKAQNTELLGDLSRSTGGRQELLKRFAGGTGYTQGQQDLDNLLLGQSGDALNQTRRATQGLTQDVTGANTQAAALGQEYSNRAKIFGEDTVKQLTETQNPLLARVNQQFADTQAKEGAAGANLTEMQNVLLGKGNDYKNLDNISRLGLGLQEARNSGQLSAAQEAALLDGDQGLLLRALNQGLDVNSLIGEKVTGRNAQNLTRAGVASDRNASSLNAIDRLLGKTGSDLEFGADRAKYQAGGLDFNLSELEKQVKEAEGYKEPAQGSVSPYKLTPTEQMAMGSAPAMKAMSGTGEMLDTVASLYGGDFISGENRMGQAGEGFVQTGTGAVRMVDEGENSVLKKLANMGAGKYGGKQLNDLIDTQSKLKESALSSLTKEGTNMLGGMKDLTTTGRMDQALAKMSGYDAMKNIGNNINNATKKALFGGETGNWGTAEYNTKDATTGQKVKVGSYANRSSQDILKQLVNQQQLTNSSSLGKGGAEGAKQLGLLVKYYNDALKREQKATAANNAIRDKVKPK